MSLFQQKENDYGDEYKAHFFEQYKLYVDSAEKVSDRRQSANNYFLTINTILISLLGVSFQYSGFDEAKKLSSFAGVIICIIWWILIHSYRQLNTGKFKVIHDIEKTLPLSLYEHEWKILGEGKDKDKYFPFSHVEQKIPWVFGFIYSYLLSRFFGYI